MTSRISAPPGVDLIRVSRTYDDPAVTALTDIDLRIEPGSFVAVVGASGCGKSTLLHLVGGLDDPSKGRIIVADNSPDAMRARKQIGWMAQQPALLPWRTVRDNVALAQRINPQPDRRLSDPDALLAMVGLSDFAGSYPGRLSGGMQQRVSLARTLAIGAGLWLMDEPFASLDELTREALADELLAIWGSVQPTVLWVTHHISEAVKLADRIVLLTPRPGRVAGDLGVDLPRPRDETSAEFQDVVRTARTILRTARDTAGAPIVEARP